MLVLSCTMNIWKYVDIYTSSEVPQIHRGTSWVEEPWVETVQPYRSPFGWEVLDGNEGVSYHCMFMA